MSGRGRDQIKDYMMYYSWPSEGSSDSDRGNHSGKKHTHTAYIYIYIYTHCSKSFASLHKTLISEDLNFKWPKSVMATHRLTLSISRCTIHTTFSICSHKHLQKSRSSCLNHYISNSWNKSQTNISEMQFALLTFLVFIERSTKSRKTWGRERWGWDRGKWTQTRQRKKCRECYFKDWKCVCAQQVLFWG